MRRFLSMILVFFIVILLPNISMANQVGRDPKPVDLKTELFLEPFKAEEKIDYYLAVRYLESIISIKSISKGKIIYLAKDGALEKAMELVSNFEKDHLDVKFKKGKIELIGDTIYSISTSSALLKTSRGVKVGDNLMTLIEAYGLPLRTDYFNSKPHLFTETKTGYIFTYAPNPHVYFDFKVDHNAIIKHIKIGISRN